MPNEKILVVEDEGITVLHMRKALEEMGYIVAGVASSAEEAIMKSTEIRPDLVLMDILLKGEVDGIEAAEKIRAILNIPVIYLTAHADEATLRRAKITEPFGYIVKPFKERDLYIAIEFALYKVKMANEKNHLKIRLEDASARLRELIKVVPLCPKCKRFQVNDREIEESLQQYRKEYPDVQFPQRACPACRQ